MAVLSFCSRHRFDDIKCSTCMGITRTMHTTAVEKRQALQACCKHFNDLVLQHSVHRPPWSVSVLSMSDIKQFSGFVHSHYFLNYEYFQYVFTPAVTLSFQAVDPRSWYEVPPNIPPLADAIDEAQYEQQKEQTALKAAEEQVAAETKVTKYGIATQLEIRSLDLRPSRSFRQWRRRSACGRSA